MRFYILLGSSLRVPPGWTFFAIMSCHGWCNREDNGVLALTRPGPFVPPITLPEMENGPEPQTHALVVTDLFRRQLEESGLTGLSFCPVIKRHIFFMEWETWVLTQTAPPAEIETTSPVAYFPQRPHSAEIAAALEDLWEVVPEEHATWSPETGIANWDGTDWFLAEHPPRSGVYLYVSERAKTWLSENVPQWVSFWEIRPRIA